MKHVCRGAVALGLDQEGELGGVAEAGLDLDPRLGSEGIEHRSDEIFAAAGVDGDRGGGVHPRHWFVAAARDSRQGRKRRGWQRRRFVLSHGEATYLLLGMPNR